VITLTDTLSVEWDGACWVLTQTLPVRKRDKATGKLATEATAERAKQRYYPRLADACKVAMDLSGVDCATLAEVVAEWNKVTKAVKGIADGMGVAR
jgi:hypothetical protein